MSASHDDQIFVPKPVMWSMLALCLFAIVSAGVSRAMRIGTVRESVGVVTRTIPFVVPLANIGVGQPVRALIATRGDGDRVVLAGAGQEIFPRLILQGVANVRARDGASPTAPLLLQVAADGERLLVDPATRRIVRLAAFGRENGASFDALLAPAGSRSE